MHKYTVTISSNGKNIELPTTGVESAVYLYQQLEDLIGWRACVEVELIDGETGEILASTDERVCC